MVQLPLVTLFDPQITTHSVTTPDHDGSKSCGLICFIGLIISLYTASNVTNEQYYWLS